MFDVPLVSAVISLLGLAQRPYISSSSITADRWQNLNSSVAGKLYTSGKQAAWGPCEGMSGWLGSGASTHDTQSSFGMNFFSQPAQTRLNTCLAPSDNHKRYFIDVWKPEDVVAAFHFAHQTRVPLVTANLATDFCRSNAPVSLGLWTKNLNLIRYIPRFIPSSSGGVKSVPAISFEIGATAEQLVEFADSLSLTVAVDSVSGPLKGDDRITKIGTSFLAPSLGLGVDNILELEVVTPDGKYRKVNQYENPDLWFALRGGGSDNFAVVVRVILKVHPQIKLQTFSASFNPSDVTTQRLVEIATLNAVRWARDGWGGYIRSHGIVLTTSKLDQQAARTSLKPLTDLLSSLRGKPAVKGFTQHDSQLQFDRYISSRATPDSAVEHAVGSRLIPESIFTNEIDRQSLVRAVVRGSRMLPSWSINLATPYGLKPDEGAAPSAVNPVIYDSLWDVVFSSELTNKSNVFERRLAYSSISKIATYLRYITPDSATCFSHADLSEPNHEKFFWGNNYPKLLQIKKHHDPQNVLTTWKGVGWQGQHSDPRFSCYTPTRLTWVRCDRYCQ